MNNFCLTSDRIFNSINAYENAQDIKNNVNQILACINQEKEHFHLFDKYTMLAHDIIIISFHATKICPLCIDFEFKYRRYAGKCIIDKKTPLKIEIFNVFSKKTGRKQIKIDNNTKLLLTKLLNLIE